MPTSLAMSLAYTTTKLLEENILVKNVEACEKIETISVICTGKFGTLTKN